MSIDKDVLTSQDAAVNWDSGLLRLEQVLTILETFVAAAEGRLAGADVLGDWSPVRLGNWLNRLCTRLDHPSPDIDPADAAHRNRQANAALLRALSPLAVHGTSVESAEGVRLRRQADRHALVPTAYADCLLRSEADRTIVMGISREATRLPTRSVWISRRRYGPGSRVLGSSIR